MIKKINKILNVLRDTFSWISSLDKKKREQCMGLWCYPWKQIYG